MDSQLQTDLQEKKAYVERIEKKAIDENISIKHAAAKLGCKVWAYYKYKGELRKVGSDGCRSGSADGKVESVEEHRQSMPKSLTLTVADDVYAYLENEGKGYATDADLVAQLLLHDCVRGKINAAKAKVNPA